MYFASALVAAFNVPVTPAQRALIGAWTTYDHPYSYQGRVLTRDASYWYQVLRNGTNLRINRKGQAADGWSVVSTITEIETGNSVQGDLASLAMDGNGVLHVVYYADGGATIDLLHRSSTDQGVTWSAANTIASDVTWSATANSSAALHVASNNDLHVAYSDEAGAKPYHGRSTNGGTSWTLTRVADIANSALRPGVISITSGRLLFSFTGTGDAPSVYYSDDNGAAWTAANPTNPGACFNIRMAGNGNTVHMVCQETTGTRRIIYTTTDGTSISWAAWDTVRNDTGADASLFIDSVGGVNVIFRVYPTGTFDVYHARNTGSGWVETLLTDGVDHILPTCYWQEFHRFSPAYNKPMVLLPETAAKNLYSEYLTALDLA